MQNHQKLSFKNLSDLQRLCSTEVATRNTNEKIRQIEAIRRNEKAKRLQSTPDDAVIISIKTRFQAIMSELSQELSNDEIQLADQLTLMERRAGELLRESKSYKSENRLYRFGLEAKNMIFALNNIVIRYLHDLAKKSPNTYMDYVEGKERILRMPFSSHKATISLNRNSLPFEVLNGDYSEASKNDAYQNKKSSLRGENGTWTSLLECGYLISKKNYDLYGNENPNGKDSILEINLDWIFGHSFNVLAPSEPFPLPVSSENFTLDTQKEYSTLSKIHYSDNQSGEATPQEIVPTTVGENEEEKVISGVKAPYSDEKEKTAPAPDFLMNEAQKDTNWILKAIFNKKRLENGQIRSNSTTRCTHIRPQDVQEMPYWIIQNYQLAHINGENWEDTIERVRAAITRKINYLNVHPSGYVYTPAMWLSPAMTGMTKYTLRWYIQNFMHDFTKNDNKTSVYDAAPLSASAWLIANGANEGWVKGVVKRHGEEFVLNCVRYAKAKLQNGLELKNNKPNAKIAYIIGILNRKDGEIMAEKASIQEKKIVAKAIWTIERVQGLIPQAVKTAEWQQNIKMDHIQRIVADIAYRNVSESQVKDLLYDIARNKSTKYNS